MADPKDDDFDSVLRSVRGGGADADANGGDDDFESTLASVGLAKPAAEEPPSAPASEPSMGTGNRHLDTLLKWYTGMAEAATGNHFGEVGKLGTRAGTALADLLQPSRVRDGKAPEYVGERGANADELVERSMDSPVGKLGYATGVVAPALMSGGASAATIPTRAAVGAAQGGLAAHGDSGLDPQAILTGAATGGALAGLGGAAGARAESAVPLSHATRAERALETLAEAAKGAGVRMGTGAAAGALLSSGSQDPAKMLTGAAAGALGGAALGKAGAVAPKLAPLVGPAARAMGTAAAPLAAPVVARPNKASAQADVAYGTAPTMAWAVESVLQSGTSGLDPADEQQLTEAVMSGDEDRLIAANFTAQQRSPAFAARLRRELESLQEE